MGPHITLISINVRSDFYNDIKKIQFYAALCHVEDYPPPPFLEVFNMA